MPTDMRGTGMRRVCECGLLKGATKQYLSDTFQPVSVTMGPVCMSYYIRHVTVIIRCNAFK